MRILTKKDILTKSVMWCVLSRVFKRKKYRPYLDKLKKSIEDIDNYTFYPYISDTHPAQVGRYVSHYFGVLSCNKSIRGVQMSKRAIANIEKREFIEKKCKWIWDNYLTKQEDFASLKYEYHLKTDFGLSGQVDFLGDDWIYEITFSQYPINEIKKGAKNHYSNVTNYLKLLQCVIYLIMAVGYENLNVKGIKIINVERGEVTTITLEDLENSFDVNTFWDEIEDDVTTFLNYGKI